MKEATLPIVILLITGLLSYQLGFGGAVTTIFLIWTVVTMILLYTISSLMQALKVYGHLIKDVVMNGLRRDGDMISIETKNLHVPGLWIHNFVNNHLDKLSMKLTNDDLTVTAVSIGDVPGDVSYQLIIDDNRPINQH